MPAPGRQDFPKTKDHQEGTGEQSGIWRDSGDSSSRNSSGVQMGFSNKIRDPFFTKRFRQNQIGTAVFAFGIALIALLGFGIYGMTSSEMSFAEALRYGMMVAGMFCLIGIWQVLKNQRNKDWEGTVVDRRVQEKERKDGDGVRSTYLEYLLVVRKENGKQISIPVRSGEMLAYYEVGDRVHCHAKFHEHLEKYDKTKDRENFCILCGTLVDMRNDTCPRCKGILLK